MSTRKKREWSTAGFERWLRAWHAWVPDGAPIGLVQDTLDRSGPLSPAVTELVHASAGLAGLPVSLDRYPTQRVAQRLPQVAGRWVGDLRLELEYGPKRRTTLRVYTREEWAAAHPGEVAS